MGRIEYGGRWAEECGGIKKVLKEKDCLEDNKTAQFVYTVSVDPNVGSEQTYGYKFASQNVEGEFTSTATIKTEEGEIVSSSDLAAGDLTGEITVGLGVESFQIVVDAEAGKKLRGDETLELSIGDQRSDPVGLGEGNCEGISPDIAIEAQGACEPEGTLSARDAEFSFCCFSRLGKECRCWITFLPQRVCQIRAT